MFCNHERFSIAGEVKKSVGEPSAACSGDECGSPRGNVKAF
jgi:hypothetical protein